MPHYYACNDCDFTSTNTSMGDNRAYAHSRDNGHCVVHAESHVEVYCHRHDH